MSLDPATPTPPQPAPPTAPVPPLPDARVVEVRNAHETRLRASKGIERRMLTRSMELRADGDSPGVLVGHAAVYDEPADLGYMAEVIAPGAFDEVLSGTPTCAACSTTTGTGC